MRTYSWDMTRQPRPPRRYDGQVAVVTGASSGIGRAIALTLAERGASVIGLARRAGLLEELSAELSRLSSDSATELCDVGDADAYRNTLARLENEREPSTSSSTTPVSISCCRSPAVGTPRCVRCST